MFSFPCLKLRSHQLIDPNIEERARSFHSEVPPASKKVPCLDITWLFMFVLGVLASDSVILPLKITGTKGRHRGLPCREMGYRVTKTDRWMIKLHVLL